jgi:hypothetical protein
VERILIATNSARPYAASAFAARLSKVTSALTREAGERDCTNTIVICVGSSIYNLDVFSQTGNPV